MFRKPTSVEIAIHGGTNDELSKAVRGCAAAMEKIAETSVFKPIIKKNEEICFILRAVESNSDEALK